MAATKPDNIVREASERSLTLRWRNLNDHNYEVTITGPDLKKIYADARSPFQVTGLSPFTDYEVEIAAEFDDDIVKSDKIALLTKADAPDSAPITYSWVRGRSIVVSWDLSAQISRFNSLVEIGVQLVRFNGPSANLVASGRDLDVVEDLEAPPGTSVYALRFYWLDPHDAGTHLYSDLGPSAHGTRQYEIINSSRPSMGAVQTTLLSPTELSKAMRFWDNDNDTGSDGGEAGDGGESYGGEDDGAGDSGDEGGQDGFEDEGGDAGNDGGMPDNDAPVNEGRVHEWGTMHNEKNEVIAHVGTEYSSDGKYARDVERVGDNSSTPLGGWQETTDDDSTEGSSNPREEGEDRHDTSDHIPEYDGNESEGTSGPVATLPAREIDRPEVTKDPKRPEQDRQPQQGARSHAPPTSRNVPIFDGLDKVMRSLQALHGGDFISFMKRLLDIPAGAYSPQKSQMQDGGGPFVGPYIIDDPKSLKGKNSADFETQCVRLLQIVSERQGNPIGQTKNWRPMGQVKENRNIARGTAIATFESGRYPTGNSPKHAAIFVEFVENGIRVIDQNVPAIHGQKVGERIIYFDNTKKFQNNANNYWVIGTMRPSKPPKTKRD